MLEKEIGRRWREEIIGEIEQRRVDVQLVRAAHNKNERTNILITGVIPVISMLQ